MAAKPATIPTWATNANYAAGSDPWSGTARKVAPSAGERADGHTPNTAPGAQHENYDRNLHGLWVTYLDDLHNSTDFLNKNYAWTGLHTFDSGVVINAALTVAGAILGTLHIAADGDVRTMGDFEYCDTNGNQTFPVRTMMIPLTRFVDCDPATTTRRWIMRASESSAGGSDNYAVAVGSPDEDSMAADICLPHGATLTGVTASAHQSDAGDTVNMKMFVLLSEAGAAGVAPSVTVLGSDTHDGTTGDTLSVTGLSTGIDNENEHYVVRFTSSDAPALNTDTVYWVKVTFTDPGVRNY